MTVCLKQDEYVTDLEQGCMTASWRARLSNGDVVIQDDDRPGMDPPQAWLRLQDYVRKNGLSITKIWLQFRSNIQADILPENADGYYFCKQALSFLHGSKTFHFYILGSLQNGKLVVQRWKVPELVLVEKEERDPATAGVCLILNPGVSIDGSPQAEAEQVATEPADSTVPG